MEKRRKKGRKNQKRDENGSTIVKSFALLREIVRIEGNCGE